MVTGASGFVGSRFIKDYGSQYEILPVSLRSTPIDKINFDGVDAIVHCAALVHQMKGAPEEEYFRINRDLTLELARAAKSAGVKHFVFLSTAHVFGDSGSVLAHGTTYDELSLPCPTDPYGKSKLDAERGLKDLESPQLIVSILRPPMIYGEGAKGNLLALAGLIQKVPILPLGYHLNKRSLFYVGNLTQMISTLIDKRLSGVFLPQDKDPISIKYLVQLIARSLQRKVWLIPLPHFVVCQIANYHTKLASRLFGTLALNSRRTNSALNYDPHFSTEEGLRRMFNSSSRIKVARTVTVPEAVEFHLRNTLDILNRHPELYDLEVIGTSVSKFNEKWPNVKWTDITISRKINFISDFRALIQLILHFQKHRFDIVHSIMPKASLLTALAGFIIQIPVRIHTFTGQTWANKKGLSKWLLVFFDKLTVRLSTYCYTDSHSQSQFLFENGIHIKKKPLPVIGEGSIAGVNLERFNPQARDYYRDLTRNQLGIPKDAIVYSFLGRKCEDKGVFELLEAFEDVAKKNANVYLLLVGPDDDPYFQEKFNVEYKGNSRVINIGFSYRPEELLAASDVFCLPSYREGFGSVVIESAALGIPSIGTRIPGLVDAIVENETGWLVAKKDSNQLSTLMKRLIENPDAIKQFGQRAELRAKQQFSSERLFNLLLGEYHFLMEAPKN